MLGYVVTGIVLICITTVIHAVFMVVGMRAVFRRELRHGRAQHDLAKALIVSLLVAWMCISLVCEVLLWAAYYRWNPEVTVLPDLETAFYFSMVTFTSVGYGDIVLTGSPRVLASLQAANGVIIFGWTTALIFFYVQHVYRKT